MYYKLNDKNEIWVTSDREEEGFLYTDDAIVSSYDGQRLVFKSETETLEYIEAQKKYLNAQNIEILRQQRKEECFSVINRGELWYSRLSAAQKTELEQWYGAWLDVTETLTSPDKPAWLK